MRFRGFTILEILVVISIIGVLIGIAIPRFKGMRDEGNFAKAKGELKTLQAAVESYRFNHANTNPNTITTDLINAFPQMISSALIDPFSNTGYVYSQSGAYYALSSVGPNGTAETADMASDGTVASSGDDMLATNGTVSALDMTSDTSNCGTVGNVCSGGASCTSGVCVPSCTSFTYSAWSACTAQSTQTRTVATQSPDGCTGGAPVLSQSCTFNPCAAQEAGDLVGQACTGTTAVYAGIPHYMTTPANAANSNWATAVAYCAGLNSGGYATGWFLPSKSQLNDVLYPHRVALGMGIFTYWSSTESSPGVRAWFQAFSLGFQGDLDESLTDSVRCVRSY